MDATKMVETLAIFLKRMNITLHDQDGMIFVWKGSEHIGTLEPDDTGNYYHFSVGLIIRIDVSEKRIVVIENERMTTLTLTKDGYLQCTTTAETGFYTMTFGQNYFKVDSLQDGVNYCSVSEGKAISYLQMYGGEEYSTAACDVIVDSMELYADYARPFFASQRLHVNALRSCNPVKEVVLVTLSKLNEVLPGIIEDVLLYSEPFQTLWEQMKVKEPVFDKSTIEFCKKLPSSILSSKEIEESIQRLEHSKRGF